MNIDRNRGIKGFIKQVAPYATAASGAALGFITAGPAGAFVGGKLGYDVGSGNLDAALEFALGETLPTNKRKRE